MPRYILINAASGFIWGDRAADDPIKAACEMEREFCEGPRVYHYRPHGDRPHGAGYYVYSVREDFPTDYDGTRNGVIARVEAEGSREGVLDVLWDDFHDGGLWIHDSGATTAEIKRGVEAALAVFQRRGVSPAAAWKATLAMADDRPYDQSLVEAWEEADSAAVTACCEGWQSIPDAAQLVLEGGGEE